MIISKSGDILKTTAISIVNPVNCEGVMGKGLAKKIKQHYPNTFKSYKDYCKQGKMSIGTVHVYFENGKYIISLPTKVKWREPSSLEYIATGLEHLITAVNDLELDKIAVPALGCGNGGLNWPDVKLLIEEKLSPLRDSIFYVYEPYK